MPAPHVSLDGCGFVKRDACTSRCETRYSLSGRFRCVVGVRREEEIDKTHREKTSSILLIPLEGHFSTTRAHTFPPFRKSVFARLVSSRQHFFPRARSHIDDDDLRRDCLFRWHLWFPTVKRIGQRHWTPLAQHGVFRWRGRG